MHLLLRRFNGGLGGCQRKRVTLTSNASQTYRLASTTKAVSKRHPETRAEQTYHGQEPARVFSYKIGRVWLLTLDDVQYVIHRDGHV